MKTECISKFQEIDTVMNALTIGGVAIACAVVVAFSSVPGLSA